MIFKLNNQEVQVEVSPNVTETQDESLDTARVVLAANTVRQPYATGQIFEIILNENTEQEEKIQFYVLGDNVTVFSYNPLRYKHELSLIQNTRKLSKHIVRNSVFSQPAQKTKRATFTHTQALGRAITIGNDQVAYLGPVWDDRDTAIIKTRLSRKEKILGTPYVTISNIVAVHSGAMVPAVDQQDQLYENMSIADMQSNNTAIYPYQDAVYGTFGTNIQFIDRFVVYWTTYNDNTTRSKEIYLSQDADTKPSVTNVKCNQKYYLSELKDILNQYNVKDIWIETRQDTVGGINSYEGIYVQDKVAGKNWFVKPENGKNFTSMVAGKITLNVDVYQYTCYDIIKLLIERQKREWGTVRNQALFGINDDSETAEILKQTVAPNFTFTQCTMYECLAEVFRLFDAIFTMDENNNIHIEYLNEQSKTPIQTDFSSESRTIQDDRRNNGLISYYQDARVDEIYPSTNTFARATSEEYGVPSENDHIFETPHRIYNIKKVWLSVYLVGIPRIWSASSLEYAIARNNNIALDITPYVVEQSIWQTLSVSGSISDYREITQYNSVPYTKNGNVINIGGSYKSSFLSQLRMIMYNAEACAYGRATGCPVNLLNDLIGFNGTFGATNLAPIPGVWQDYRFRIEYETSLDGRVKIESYNDKYPGDMLIDQYNGSVDINKMGLNMLGISLKLGEPTLMMTHKISSWNDRVKKGSIYIENGVKWVASVCSYTFINDNYIQGQITFTKNFNALSQRVRLNRERRMTNISQELTQKSEDNYLEYIYFSSVNISGSNNGRAITTTDLSNMLYAAFSNEDYNRKIQQATISISGSTEQYVVPLSCYPSGNTYCFEMAYNSPISAGKRTVKRSGWFGDNQLWTEYLKYTDDEGFLDEVDIRFFDAEHIYDVPNASIKYTNLPRATVGGNGTICLNNYKLYKQPNEIFAFNYELCFLPVPEREHTDFLGEGFFNRYNADKAKQLFVYFGTNGEKYDIFE